MTDNRALVEIRDLRWANIVVRVPWRYLTYYEVLPSGGTAVAFDRSQIAREGFDHLLLIENCQYVNVHVRAWGGDSAIGDSWPMTWWEAAAFWFSFRCEQRWPRAVDTLRNLNSTRI